MTSIIEQYDLVEKPGERIFPISKEYGWRLIKDLEKVYIPIFSDWIELPGSLSMKRPLSNTFMSGSDGEIPEQLRDI